MKKYILIKTVTVSIAMCLLSLMCSEANPIVIDSDTSESQEQRPTILGRENLVINLKSDHSEISGTFVFAKSQTDKSKHRIFLDFFKGYLCLPVYVPVDQTNNTLVESFADMKVVCQNQSIKTKISPGTPLVHGTLQRNCPKELRIVWFIAKLKEDFLAKTHKKITISYKQKYFKRDGNLMMIYTPMLPVTHKLLEKSSDEEIEEYKKWYKITVKNSSGINFSLNSKHVLPVLQKHGERIVCPVDFEPLVIVVNGIKRKK
ncbi:hypothetical protein ACFLS1_09195 [Verrucomicrobiota bacterium]